MPDYNFEEVHKANFKKLLAEHKEAIVNKICSGGCETFASYKKECGRIAALNDALEIYAHAFEKATKGEGTENVAELITTKI